MLDDNNNNNEYVSILSLCCYFIIVKWWWYSRMDAVEEHPSQQKSDGAQNHDGGAHVCCYIVKLGGHKHNARDILKHSTHTLTLSLWSAREWDYVRGLELIPSVWGVRVAWTRLCIQCTDTYTQLLRCTAWLLGRCCGVLSYRYDVAMLLWCCCSVLGGCLLGCCYGVMCGF